MSSFLTQVRGGPTGYNRSYENILLPLNMFVSKRKAKTPRSHPFCRVRTQDQDNCIELNDRKVEN